MKVKPRVVRGTVVYKTIKYDSLGKGLSLMSVNIRVVTKSDFLAKVNFVKCSLHQLD